MVSKIKDGISTYSIMRATIIFSNPQELRGEIEKIIEKQGMVRKRTFNICLILKKSSINTPLLDTSLTLNKYLLNEYIHYTYATYSRISVWIFWLRLDYQVMLTTRKTEQTHEVTCYFHFPSSVSKTVYIYSTIYFLLMVQI